MLLCRPLHLFLGVLVLLCAAPVLKARDADGTGLQGRVVDRAGRPLAGAQVERLPDGASTWTLEDGSFRFETPPSGDTQLRLTAYGFEAASFPVPRPVPEGWTLRLRRMEILVVRAFSEEATSLEELSGDALSPEQISNPTQAVARMPGGSSTGKGGHDNVPAIRGLARGRTLVLLEETRLTSERRVGVSASFLPTPFLRRIRITRGAEGTLNGSDAIGGVVELHLREPAAEPGFRMEWGASASTRGSGVEPWLVTEGAGTRWAFLGALAGRDHEAYDGGGRHGTIGDTDYLDRGFWLRGVRRSDDSQLKIGWLHLDADHVGRPDNRFPLRRSYLPTEDHDLATLRYTRRLPGGDLLETGAAMHRRESVRINEVYRNDGSPSREEFARDESHDWNLRAAWLRERDRVRIQAGADLLLRRNITGFNRVVRFPAGGGAPVSESATPVRDGRREDLGVFASLRLDPHPELALEMGARADRVRTEVPEAGSRDETDWSGHLGLAWREGHPFGAGFVLGRGFRTPGVYELFYTGLSGRGFVFGNEDLPKESASTAEVRLAGAWSGPSGAAGIRWEVRAFRTELRDFTDRISQGDEFFFLSRDRARIEGLEAVLTARWRDHWSLEAVAQRLRGRDRSTGETLNDMPQDRLLVTAAWRPGTWSLGTRLHLTRGRDDVGPDEIPIGGFLLWDLEGSFRMGRGFDLAWRFENLLDRGAFPNADDRGVPLAGRSLTVTVRHRWSPGS